MKNWKNTGPLYVKDYSKVVHYTYSNFEDFANNCPVKLDNFTDRFDRLYVNEVRGRFRSVLINRNYILVDDLGLVVPLWKIEEVYNQYLYIEWRRRQKPFVLRNGPVEGIGHSHWHKGSYYRRVKTFQEHRSDFTTEDEDFYGVKVRCKRNSKNLPNAWDDIPRHCCDRKNWKYYRKHQWK